MNTLDMTKRVCLAAMFAAALSLATPALAQAQLKPGGPEKTTMPPALQFHYMGPPPGGRIASASGVPGNLSIVYLGSASGGLWKSTDGGYTFMPIFDDQDTSAIGAIAIAPADHDTVWVGTGEPWLIRPSDIVGDGVYKSTNAGKTWQHMGLVDTGRIARIIINPQDTNNVLVCAEGRGSSPQQERGVYRTTDGGKTWKRTLFVNEHTGCSGLSIDPSNPNTLLAGTWQVTQRTWAEDSGGPGSGVYISHDNGRNWKRLTARNGLPKPPVGKVNVAIAPSNPQRMYALIQTKDQGSMWRTDNGGTNWKVVSWDRTLIMRAGYYFGLAVSPKNDNDVVVQNSQSHYSSDGGQTFSGEGGSAPIEGPARCGDCHDVWIDPDNPAHYILTGDGGASIATGAGTAINVSLPNGQMYHVASDNRVPYWLYTNRQDNGTWRGPSDVSTPSGNGLLRETEFMPMGIGSRPSFFSEKAGKFDINTELLAQYPKAAPPPKGWALGPNGEPKTPPNGSGFFFAATPRPEWEARLGGCESGFTIPDPTDANIVWSTCYGNKITRYNALEGTARSVSPSEISLDSPPNETKYRCHWTAPMAIDPFNHNNVYFGCQLVFRTSDAGQDWIEFSPDLSTRDPSRIVPSGGIMQDNLGQYDGEVVWSLAFSHLVKGLLWAGTNDGKLWYTRGAESQIAPQWVDVTKNLHLPPWGKINQISPSYFHPGTVYIAVDFHLAGHDNHKPYILETTNYGMTWNSVSGDLPSSNPLDYVLTVAENPNREGMLFTGSGHAFYYTLDNGAHWIHFSKGLPPSPVTWINIEPRMHDIDVSTYGRGIYIMPDITTFEQTGSPESPSGGPTRLFKPGEVFRKARSAYPTVAEPARPQFQFYLTDAPDNPVKLQILDSRGQVLRTEKLDAHQGLNGAYWDLMYNSPTDVELLTTPSVNPHIWEEPRFKGKTVRPVRHWGISPSTGTPIAAPGDYEVRLQVDGQAYTQQFEVVKDPAVLSSNAQLQDSTALQVELRDAITETSNMVNQMEQWRRQIQDDLKSNPTGSAASALHHLNQQIVSVENQLVSQEARTSDVKQYSTPYKVYLNLLWLAGAVGQGAGDVAGNSDHEPTATQRRLAAKLEAQLATARAGFENLKTTTLSTFNREMGGKGVTINMGG